MISENIVENEITNKKVIFIFSIYVIRCFNNKLKNELLIFRVFLRNYELWKLINPFLV